MALSHRFRSLATTLLAAHTVTMTAAVSLSDFVPSILSLPPPCLTVYNQVIEGCVAQDFDATKQRCSAACVSGLVDISQAVNRACTIDDASETSIIGVFLQGKGIPILCQGVSVTTIGGSSKITTSSSTTSTTSTEAQATSTNNDTPSQTQNPQTNRATSSSTLATSAANPQTSASTQPPPISSAADQLSFSWSLPSSTSSPPAVPQQTVSSQKSNSDSGGGSPFDIVATGSSSRPQNLGTSIVGALLGLAMLAYVMT